MGFNPERRKTTQGTLAKFVAEELLSTINYLFVVVFAIISIIQLINFIMDEDGNFVRDGNVTVVLPDGSNVTVGAMNVPGVNSVWS